MGVYTYTYLHTQTTLGTWPSPQIFFLGAPNIGPLTYLGQVGRNPPGNLRGKEGPTGGCFFILTKEELGNNKKKCLEL